MNEEIKDANHKNKIKYKKEARERGKQSNCSAIVDFPVRLISERVREEREDSHGTK